MVEIIRGHLLSLGIPEEVIPGALVAIGVLFVLLVAAIIRGNDGPKILFSLPFHALS